MQIILKKRLTPSEKERHWVRIPENVRSLFPPDEVKFKVRVGRGVRTTRIDCYRRLFLGSIIFGDLDLDIPNARIVVEKDDKGEYVVRKNEE